MDYIGAMTGISSFRVIFTVSLTKMVENGDSGPSSRKLPSGSIIVCQRKGASRAAQESEHLSRAVGEPQSVSASTVQSIEVDTVSLGCARPAYPGIHALQRFFLSDTSHKDIIADL